MRRRDIPKALLASSAAGTGLLAKRIEATPNLPGGLENALRVAGNIRVADGTYKITAKLQTLLPNTIIGDSRHNTLLVPGGFADYVLEVGNGGPGPNAGKIQRLRFYGATGNLGCLHMNSLSHMWRLEELLFSGGPCPAMVIDNCWDSNYTDIDILAHVGRSGDPARDAAVIFRNGSNNIYCRGLRIEGAHGGGIYTDCGPIYVVTGKIDAGFGGPQSAPAITVGPLGHLVLDDFYLGGMLNQFQIDVAGTLKLGRVFFDGGSNTVAAINDRRAWRHWNAKTFPTASRVFMGPDIPVLDLGESQFRRFHASVATEMPAAVYSRIHPIRHVQQLTTIANGAVSGNTITIVTSLSASHEDLYKDCFLVHNCTGTQSGHQGGARRRILKSFVGGNLVLQGAHEVTLDSDWSIEYCASHSTPIHHRSVWLDCGQSLFSIISRNAVIKGPLTYVAAVSDAAYGTTKFRIEGTGLARGGQLAGLYLMDNATGEPYYIQYGIDDRNFIGVIYDRRDTLDVSHTFGVIAGYAADVEVRGEAVVWTFAGTQYRASISELLEAGYGPDQVPLWGFGTPAKRPILARLAVTAAVVAVDLSRGTEFEITATDARAFTISSPVNASGTSGQRITITIRNSSAGSPGSVTWAPAYKLAAWLSPARAHSRSIDFRFDGTSWIEVGRTPADVPN